MRPTKTGRLIARAVNEEAEVSGEDIGVTSAMLPEQPLGEVTPEAGLDPVRF
jgi:hypothetical protein